MRILHWFPDFLEGGGIPNAILGLGAAQARHGAQVTVAAAGASRPLVGKPGERSAEVEVLTWRPTRSLQCGRQRWHLMPRRERAKLRALRPDILHVHGEFILDNLPAARLLGCPVVITPHGALHPVVLRKSRSLVKRLYLLTERALSLGRTKCFHALSPMEREHIAAALPRAASYCVPQGASPRIEGPPADGAPVPVAEPETITFVFLGRLDVFTKGLDILLDAFELAMQLTVRRDLHLVLAGPDCKDSYGWLQRRIAGGRLGARVRLTGSLSSAEVAALLARASIYVQLSRHEGFPLSVADALLAGKPTILSAAIGTISYPEIAALPHVNIVLPNKEAAAQAMLDAADHVPELAEAALSRRDQIREFFSWDRVARLHLDQYRQLLSR